MKSDALVADGPYRRVCNPLYSANMLMSIAMGSLMSRLGFVLAVSAMVLFCYRLIGREEEELAASEGEFYRAYCKPFPVCGRRCPREFPPPAASRVGTKA